MRSPNVQPKQCSLNNSCALNICCDDDYDGCSGGGGSGRGSEFEEIRVMCPSDKCACCLEAIKETNIYYNPFLRQMCRSLKM